MKQFLPPHEYDDGPYDKKKPTMFERLYKIIIKHNIKITVITVAIPLLIQIKALFGFVWGLLPSSTEIYDQILSIRSPFQNREKTAIEIVVSNVIKDIEKRQKLPAEAKLNMKIALYTLFQIEDDENKLKIDNILDEIKKNNFDPAIKAFEITAKKQKDEKEYIKYLLAKAYMEYFKDKASALLTYDDIIAKEPNNKFALNNIGHIGRELKTYDLAINAYNKLVKSSKEQKDFTSLNAALTNLGILYYEKGNNSLALKYYLEAIKINEQTNKPINSAPQHANIGLIYEKEKDIENACLNYRKARIYYTKKYQDNIAEKLDKVIDRLKCHE